MTSTSNRGTGNSGQLSPRLPTEGDRYHLDCGDLGRRITARRAALGLERSDLAHRAGISLPYLEYLENAPSHPPLSTLRVLARILHTTDVDLLGGTQGRPPGRGAPSPGSQLALLPEEECWQLISDHGVGRIAHPLHQDVLVVPINYAVDHGTLWIRTSPDSQLAAHTDPEGRVTVEVDRLDDVTSGGWSVLLHGDARHAEPGTSTTPEPVAVHPWVQQDRSLLLTVRVRAISGRRITW
ncbi:pyridoxamine 5'-phosphate oxidase family protein [Kineococcus sp. NPDC059986]|uniref:helix-turn-helix domain-containing protein n=1 Tax=Kineococcus sp. NPDC059986 TaxID=3155538 RepID=UPI00344D2DF1